MSKKLFHILSAQMSDHILSNVYSTWDVWLCLLGWTELCISQEGKPFRLLDIKTLLYCQSELFSRLAFANLIHQGKPRLHYEKCQLFWKRTTTEANVFNIYKFGTYFPSSKQTSQLQNLFMKFKILSVITKKPFTSHVKLIKDFNFNQNVVLPENKKTIDWNTHSLSVVL